ncbi:unnamed protein product, partial [Oncorhynchus mykiss]
RVASFKFLGIHITDKLNWSTHTDSIVKKAQQRLFNLRRLKKFGYERLASSSATLQCGASGQWNNSQPQCIAVSCPTLQQPQDGAISCGEDFTFGSSCNFSCSEGYLLKGAITLTCTSAAEWSEEIPHCEGEDKFFCIFKIDLI